MIRRKRLTVRQRAALAYKRSAAVGIGPTREERRTRARAHRRTVIAENRARVFARDAGCRRCARRGHPADHCHEVIPRSLLRGRPPEDIFNTVNCLRVCADCHELLTRHRVRVIYLDAPRGCDGDLVFTPVDSVVHP